MTRIISVLLVLLAGVPSAVGAADEPMKDAASPEAAAAPQEAAPTEPSAPLPAGAADIKLQDNPPARYTVKRGDTLWGISGHYLKNPWKWPEIWGMNKEEVKNPHLIYPGEVIVLDLSGNTPRLRLEGVADGGLSRWSGYELQVTRLEPRMRSTALATAIPTISAKELTPFLSRSQVIDLDAVALAPKVVAGVDSRVALSASDTAFAVGVDRNKGSYWSVYRPGRIFIDPDTKEMLGREAIYLGDVQVESFGEVSALRILTARQEVGIGDRLAMMPELPTLPYVPRAPDQKVRGKVIAGSNDALSEFGPLSMVVLNRGARNGLEPGQVLGLYRNQGSVMANEVSGRVVRLPLQEYGLVMVYRVFNKASFALVMTATRSVHVNDIVHNP